MFLIIIYFQQRNIQRLFLLLRFLDLPYLFLEARVKGEVVDLTIKEFEVLKYLSTQPGEVVTREMLLKKVWGYDDYVGAIRTVDVTVNRIHKY